MHHDLIAVARQPAVEVGRRDPIATSPRSHQPFGVGRGAAAAKTSRRSSVSAVATRVIARTFE
jgi:hypothetical protein